ncbi:MULTISPECIES: hypothetical protein [unclassified Streptomyces]|uniref:hypothetical protein n=1 Tax=unclassified Streptomyces TaxID=2593676 RepID=UPI0006AF6720|nr:MULTISPECIES: hypothetical protein [unclassified Streptomyces]KOX19769.1 hypothetical protein ADL06_28650 [Streptomyces sp. NRRL F-6491]KOX37892.1 hypothetical protein ADL08_28365 [Streptomyces sp. NRRL F-6492]
MNVRYARRGRASLAVASVVLLAVGCGAEEKPNENKPTMKTTSPQKSQGGQEQPTAEEPTEELAVVKGQKGLELTVNSVERDAGGFITVKGRLRNAAETVSAIPPQTSGNETEVVKHGTSLGGASLVDSVGKKRYYVLRDTDGRPLTTIGLNSLGPGKSTAVFLQFPAPPTSTTEVSFQLPTFEPATLKLS